MVRESHRGPAAAPSSPAGWTPRSSANAWFAVTPLQSALSAVAATPADLPYEEHNADMIKDYQGILKDFDGWDEEEEAKRAQR